MKKIKVGITGGIGAGKSVVSSIFQKMGFPVFNSDQEAKKLIHESFALKSEIIHLIGDKAYDKSGNYNTTFVSQLVFENPKKLEALNKLIHPKVRSAFEKFLESAESSLVFNEAALLYETNAYSNFNQIILVTAPLELRIKRCVFRDNVTREIIEKKIQNQWTDEKKRAFLPYEIINDGVKPLLTQVEDFISFILPNKRQLNTREDIELLVQTFYSKVMQDEILIPFFQHLDFNSHLPKMVDFWCFVLIGTTGYTTNVIEKHLHMPLQNDHFDHWINLFNQTLDELFVGENAETAKQRALVIAWTTKSKLNLN